MKKSYNPFKMWGSYVGAILLVIIFHFNPFSTIILTGIPYTETRYFIMISSILRTFSLGFLIGWGIHSLVRALR